MELNVKKINYNKALSEGINFTKNKLLAKSIRLTVASFNKLAIKVYKRAGFEKVHSFERITEISSKIE